MNRDQKVVFANRLIQELGIDLFDDDGVICEAEIDKLIQIVDESKKWPQPAADSKGVH